MDTFTVVFSRRLISQAVTAVFLEFHAGGILQGGLVLGIGGAAILFALTTGFIGASVATGASIGLLVAGIFGVLVRLNACRENLRIALRGGSRISIACRDHG